MSALGAEVKQFLDSGPYEVVADETSSPGKRLQRISKAENPPDGLALIAGDVVHNLRSALDLLIWQLVEANRKKPGRQDAFPIANGAKEFETTGLPRVRGRISNDAVNILRGVKPYRGGNDALWRLHKLDIADKHRTLYVVGSAFRSISLPIPLPSDWPPEALDAMKELAGKAFFRPADRMFPLKPGDVLFIDNEPTSPKTEMQFRFDVAFSLKEGSLSSVGCCRGGIAPT